MWYSKGQFPSQLSTSIQLWGVNRLQWALGRRAEVLRRASLCLGDGGQIVGCVPVVVAHDSVVCGSVWYVATAGGSVCCV